jgi:uncharacterized protein YdcH (DUF465 family)
LEKPCLTEEKSIDHGKSNKKKNVHLANQGEELNKVNNSVNKSNINNSNLDLSSNSFHSKDLLKLKSNIRGKMSKVYFEEILKPQNEIHDPEIINAYKSKIELLNQENDCLKEEKTKLKDELMHIKDILSQKDQEIKRLKWKLNVIFNIMIGNWKLPSR